MVDKVNEVVHSRGEVRHIGKSGLWFSKKSWLGREQGWQLRKC